MIYWTFYLIMILYLIISDEKTIMFNLREKIHLSWLSHFHHGFIHQRALEEGFTESPCLPPPHHIYDNKIT